jgi:small multidrug resistance family-3 protein
MDSLALFKAFGLFFITAIAELLGCYLTLLVLSNKGSSWLLLPAALSLIAFVWLLAYAGDVMNRLCVGSNTS